MIRLHTSIELPSIVHTTLSNAKVYLDRAEEEYCDVYAVNIEEMRNLNCNSRKIDAATNILSFPSQIKEYYIFHLGDLVLCPSLLEQEAKICNLPRDHHWAHLLLHGYLHLLGYDHITDEQASEMQSLETKILSSVGIQDPY